MHIPAEKLKNRKSFTHKYIENESIWSFVAYTSITLITLRRRRLVRGPPSCLLWWFYGAQLVPPNFSHQVSFSRRQFSRARPLRWPCAPCHYNNIGQRSPVLVVPKTKSRAEKKVVPKKKTCPKKTIVPKKKACQKKKSCRKNKRRAKKKVVPKKKKAPKKESRAEKKGVPKKTVVVKMHHGIIMLLL